MQDKQIKAVIFDMDGLLLDTEPLWAVSMMRVASRYGIPITPADFKATTGLRIYEVTEYWQQHFAWPSTIAPQPMAEEILDDIIGLSKEKASIMPGVLALLQNLTKQGIKIGVATSSPYRMLNELLAHFNLATWFQAKVSADDTGIGKPHPAVFLHCARLLDTPPTQCLVLEDSINGMIAGLAARMRTIVVPDEHHKNKPAFGAAFALLHSLEQWHDRYLH